MKVIIIGSGVSGLTAGAFLAKAGHQVIIFEQDDHIGGVTALAEKDGFKFEQGPLLMTDFLPGEKVYQALEEIDIHLDMIRGDRGTVMPDFPIWKPEEYAGPYWRKNYLKKLFPPEAKGLDRYYQFYDDLLFVARSTESKKMSFRERIHLTMAYVRIRPLMKLSAQELMDYFFNDEKLKAVYLGILADFCASPSEFAGLGVPFVNIETAFDKRIPLEEKGKKVRNGFGYVKGTIYSLIEALSRVIKDHGGIIKVNSTVIKVNIEQGKAKGITLANGKVVSGDIVIGSGGGKEFFTHLVGFEHLDQTYISHVESLKPMESVLMVHLGVDFNPLDHQKEALCYYYGTYDIEASIKRLRSGEYHEGKDGFLAYCPSWATPELAPEGYHCLTLYTVAPDTLARGDWDSLKEGYADTLIKLAEKYFPNLSNHIQTKLIKTPLDYRRMTLTDHSSFGGTVPDRNIVNLANVTPVENLYFIGSQSEAQGGVSGCLMGGVKVAKIILTK